MSEDPVVLVGAARTPFGAFGGRLRDVSLPDLAAVAGRGALGRAGLDGADVDEYVLGVNLPGSDRSVARQAALRTGIPDDRTAYTVDRACCSSLRALHLGRAALLAGDAEVVLAGGSENLSKVPYFLEGVRWGLRAGDVALDDQLVISCPHTGVPRAVQAADEALAHGVDRAAQDRWSLRSQQRCAAAIARGRFREEIVPVTVAHRGGDEVVADDESPRPEATEAALAALPTVNGSATVTAGNAPGLSTGAAVLALTRASTARARGLTPLATIEATAAASGPPPAIASIPATAARAVLARAGLGLDDMDLIEINEAFAAVPLVTTLVLAGGDVEAAEALRARTNVNGGAIALGHPTGATGARLVLTAAMELARRGGGRALVTLCGGIGEAEAVVLRVDGDERGGGRGRGHGEVAG